MKALLLLPVLLAGYSLINSWPLYHHTEFTGANGKGSELEIHLSPAPLLSSATLIIGILVYRRWYRH